MVLRERDEHLTRLYSDVLAVSQCTRFLNIKKACEGYLRCFCSSYADRSSGRHLIWGDRVVATSVRALGTLVWLGLLSGALALPLGAEEITVTIPPDDTPAQSQPIADSSTADPTAHPTDSSPSPTAMPAQETPAAEAAPAASPPAAAEAAPPAAPATVKKHKVKKAAAATPAPVKKKAAEAAAGEAAPPAAAAKTVKKTKTAKASCLNLTEDACGTNTACIWVAAGTNDAGKPMKARCRSMAILKREAEKAAKAAKSEKPEVLPWATGAVAAPTAKTASAEAKPVKKKTVAKKAKPKPAVMPAAAEAAPADGGESSGAAGPPVDAGGAD